MNMLKALSALADSAKNLTAQGQYVSRLNSDANTNAGLFTVPKVEDRNRFFDDVTGVTSPDQVRDMLTALSNAQSHASPPPVTQLIDKIAGLKEHAGDLPELENRATKISRRR